MILWLRAQGMEWLLKMYLEGECSDYRFTYDAYAPSAYQLISMFHANGSPEASSAEPADRQADESADGEVPVDEASNAPAPAPTPVNSQVSRNALHLWCTGEPSEACPTS